MTGSMQHFALHRKLICFVSGKVHAFQLDTPDVMNVNRVNLILVARLCQITQNFTFSFKDLPNQSTNFNILVDGIECNRYDKDGNTGPSYSCNKIGQNVTISRWDTEVFSVCNIKVYQGEYCRSHYHLF